MLKIEFTIDTTQKIAKSIVENELFAKFISGFNISSIKKTINVPDNIIDMWHKIFCMLISLLNEYSIGYFIIWIYRCIYIFVFIFHI